MLPVTPLMQGKTLLERIGNLVLLGAVSASIIYPAHWGVSLLLTLPIAIGVAAILTLGGVGIIRLVKRHQSDHTDRPKPQ